MNLSLLFFKPTEFFVDEKTLIKSRDFHWILFLTCTAPSIALLAQKVILETAGRVPQPQNFVPLFDWLLFSLQITLTVGVTYLSVYYIGSWWTNRRIDWSTDQRFDEEKGKIINVYITFISSILVSIVQFVTTVLGTFLSIDQFIQSFIIIPFFVVISIGSSIYSYLVVKELFSTRKTEALLWFVILPVIFFVFLALLWVFFLTLLRSRMTS